jgi:hypothetical protein
MALPKFTLYKHVKLVSGWRYCKAARHTNSKVKPNVVLVNGVEQTHRDGSCYFSHNNTWIPAGDNALEASRERLKRRNAAEYHRLNGTAYPDQKKTSEPVGMTLQMAADAYLAERERGVHKRTNRGEWDERDSKGEGKGRRSHFVIGRALRLSRISIEVPNSITH